MKNPILLIGTLFFFFTTLAAAQNWGTDGARWWYDYSNNAYIGYTEISVNGDTVLDNRNVKIFQKTTNYYHQVLGEYSVFERSAAYMYEKEGIVYLWQEGNFDTLYNFNASVGETWSIKGSFDFTVNAKVLDKGVRMVNNQALKWSEVEYRVDKAGYERYVLSDTIVEKIGNLHSYMFPWDYFAGQTDGNEGGFLRCYYDNKLNIYHNPFYNQACNTIQKTFWGGEDATWWYSRSAYGEWGYIKVSLNHDTIINNQVCQIIQKQVKVYSFLSREIWEWSFEPEYTFESKGIVYLYEKYSGQFDTLYNFNAQVGATWTTPNNVPDKEITARVLDKGFSWINEYQLRWLLIEYERNYIGISTVRDTIYERIGNTRLYFLPWDYFEHQLDGGESGGGLRCYEDYTIGLYRPYPGDTPCDFITTTSEVHLNNNVTVAPNPFSDVIAIVFSKPTSTAMEIVLYSVEGRMVKRIKLFPNTEKLELSLAELHRGYYFLTLTTHGKVEYVTKLVKI